MKRVKFLAMLLAGFMLSMTFVACGGDDDETPPPTIPENELTVIKTTFVGCLYYRGNALPVRAVNYTHVVG